MTALVQPRNDTRWYRDARVTRRTRIGVRVERDHCRRAPTMIPFDSDPTTGCALRARGHRFLGKETISFGDPPPTRVQSGDVREPLMRQHTGRAELPPQL